MKRLLATLGAVLALTFGAFPASAGGFDAPELADTAPAFDQALAADQGGAYQVAELATTAYGPLALKSGRGAGGSPPVATAPVLAPVSTNFGKWTAQGRGSVRPSSPYLGLVVSDGGSSITGWNITAKAGACANPNQWLSSGNSATGTGLAESSSRRLPAPSGDSNITTNCTWEVEAINAIGTSNKVDYAVTVDPCAIQIGDLITDDSYDYGAMGVAFSSFAAATEVADGCPVRKILIAEGIQRQSSGIGFSNLAFDAPVYVQNADATNPAPIRRVSCSASAPNMVFTGLHFSAPGSSWPDTGAPNYSLTETAARIYIACNGGKAIDNVVGRDPSDYRLDLNGIDVAADDVVVSGNIIRFASRGLNIADNSDRLVAFGNDIRKWHRNGIFFGQNNITDALVYRNLVSSTDVTEAETGPSVHPDNIQFSDNNVGHTGNRILQNVFCSLSDTSGTQGWFSGAGQPTSYEVSENLFCINLANGIAVNGNGGASKINDNTLIKFETGQYAGVEYPPEPGAGPWISLEGSTSPKWTGTLEVKRNVTQDNVITSGFAAPTLGAGADANVEFSNGTMTGFTVGNPQAVGEAYFAANNSDAMSMDALFTYLKQLTRRGDGKGWVDSSGAFKRSLPRRRRPGGGARRLPARTRRSSAPRSKAPGSRREVAAG